jgi:hypothetical protein
MILKSEHYLAKDSSPAPFPENSGSSSRPLDDGPSQSMITDAGEIEFNGRTYVRPTQLANILGITVRTLLRWHKCQLGPPRITVGRLTLYEVSKLSQWLETHENTFSHTTYGRKTS